MNNVTNRFAVAAIVAAALALGACGGNDDAAGDQQGAGTAPDESSGVNGGGEGVIAKDDGAGTGGATTLTASRGSIEVGSCESGELVEVDSSAVAAVYFDEKGDVVGASGEDLAGTTDNKMCPTPALSGPGLCQSGYCPRSVGGRQVCMRC